MRRAPWPTSITVALVSMLVQFGTASACETDADDAAKVTLKVRGPHLALPPLPLALPFRLQLSAATGACWEARFDAGGVQQHDPTRFKAQGD
jgi:hypothetical protein